MLMPKILKNFMLGIKVYVFRGADRIYDIFRNDKWSTGGKKRRGANAEDSEKFHVWY